MLGGLLLRSLARAGVQADLAVSLAQARETFAPGLHSHAVVDLTLPDGSGGEWLAEILAQDTALIGVLSSGYPVSTELLPPPLRHRAAALQKPFAPPAPLQPLGPPPPH